jgi:hypothetical protein
LPDVLEEAIMWKLRFSMIIYGALQIVVGIFMALRPDRIYSAFSDFPPYSTGAINFASYILGIAGAIFVAGGLMIIIGSINPARNAYAVRFAILWSVLILAMQIYALIKEYVTFWNIWWILIVVAFFLLFFIASYPWPWRRELKSD